MIVERRARTSLVPLDTARRAFLLRRAPGHHNDSTEGQGVNVNHAAGVQKAVAFLAAAPVWATRTSTHKQSR